MNAYGLVLNDIGLEPFFDRVLQQVLQPLSMLLFRDSTAGHALDHHHSFMVSYGVDKDRHLDMHTDDSEVTLNVNLIDDFTGSSLTFCGLFGTVGRRKHQISYAHKRGRAVIHAGLHTHGAAPLKSGTRHNLVVWGRSSAFRIGDMFAARYRHRELAELPPDAECLSRTHDQDYDAWSRHISAHLDKDA